jgi:HEPN domain-containing protein
MRRSPLEEGQRWLRQAREDLKWAAVLAEQGANHLACFLAQQIAEKALKGYLYAQGEEVVLGHSVERLSAAAAEYDPRFKEAAQRWSILDGYYIPTRYPNGLPDGIPSDVFTADAAKGALELAEYAVDFVTSIMERMEKRD